MAGGVTWAIGTVLSKKLFLRHAIAPINFTVWQMLWGSVDIYRTRTTPLGGGLVWSAGANLRQLLGMAAVT